MKKQRCVLGLFSELLLPGLLLPGLLMSLGLLMFGALATADDRYSDYERYWVTYQASVDGDYSAKRLVGELQSDWQQYPQDPLLLLLLGSSRTLQGRDAWMPWNKLRFTEQGLEEIEQALTLLSHEHKSEFFAGLPIEVLVPALAGITFTEVPSFFGRFEQGYVLLQQASEDAIDSPARHEDQAFIHQALLQAARQVEDAAIAGKAEQRLVQVQWTEESP